MRRPLGALLAALLLTSIAIWGGSTLALGSAKSVPIVISLKGNLVTTLDPANLNILVTLERRITSLPGVQTVFGPGTFIQHSVDQTDHAISQHLAAARARGPAARRQQLSDLLVRYGYTGVPSIDNESFVGQLIFGSGTQPERRLAWLFPDGDHALLLVRLRAGLSGAQTEALASHIQRLAKAVPLQGVQVL